ncbi:MAG: Thermophilic metalloprotease (M29) superfamily [Candidatus Amesbacteria bacterium GW2011_GWA1_47_16]|uniref:Thermophilic metalloprotease (M29) superfamily n=4 Tax=Candidatus Amesiibacteriota TaxID=1752730 RepID=A0A0G1S6A2_9BACT|nr:MAG: Thermophilic metalloprotease (M29) superfamily [Candidatus Amesbacteria bacterium GW2011_GWA1_47_16]KKU65039.1 MAG: Thermophilic metalloprotease (M29) superfamily [Candidatus Amesbacteria bacterium GW2011_GWC1_47_15]KKU96492.1 MAG: Thermophilic metalloprotease (M29) superfamily [Candidatus Amesbacteria bacterium GW2011_GWB1_48_13]
MIGYVPTPEILDKYARVLVNFALNSGKGVKKGEIVRLIVSESAKPLYVALRNQVLRSGAIPITDYAPDDVAREYFELASEDQLKFFPAKYVRGLVDQIDHSIGIISETDKHELEGIDPKKIMLRNIAFKPAKEWRDAKENAGKFTWTLALYGTPAMATEAKMSLEKYWDQIIKACFLDKNDPIASWKKVYLENSRILRKLNRLKIDKLHVQGEGVNLWVNIGPGRRWLGGSGRNIPSFEVFVSPDWRGTEGNIEFNQPLYRYGSLIEGIKLKFEKGVVVKSSASKNYPILREMLAVENADKIGEFSLTDKRLSRIDKFMAETLFDENISGPWGNTHIALGSAYHDSLDGNPAEISKAQWKKLGFNDSVIHTDIISTTRRTVTAYLSDKSEKIIYRDGEFTL